MKKNLITESFRGSRMIRKIFASLLLISIYVSANAVTDNQEKIDQKVDSIQAKRGLSIGGSIRAIHLGSSFSSDQDLDGINNLPDVERMEFVNADLAFTLRPWEPVRVNAILRLEAGMQNYFASPSKSISVPWMNVEGNVGTNFYWVVGNFRQQYTPLTLFAPGIDIMYEPQIFARNRHMAQKQEFLEGNERNLQGANLQFRKYLNKNLGEMRVEGILARLRRVQVLDFTGEVGNILTNSQIPGSSQAGNADKFLGSLNMELWPLDKKLMAGLTGMFIFDDESSFTKVYRKNSEGHYVFEPVNPHDLSVQNTMVFDVRLGGDVAALIGNKNLVLDAVLEGSVDIDHTKDSVINLTTGLFDVTEDDLLGSALLLTLNAGYKSGKNLDVLLSANILRNDSAWFNNLAQSPQFFARRILNTDKDGTQIKYGVNAPLYSSFGSLYYFSPKYTPVSTSLGTDDNMVASGQTDSYNIAPFTKTSWGSTVYTKKELALIESLSDPSLQLVLPNGLATANRLGATANVKVGWSDLAEVQALVSVFSQVKPLAGFDKASYMEYGGGAKVDLAKILKLKLPLEISGSYKHSNRTIDVLTGGSSELNTDFINAGLYVQYLPRLGFSAGFQTINLEMNDMASMIYSFSSPGASANWLKGNQMQWMVGLDYSFAENAWLSINYGMISVANDYNTSVVIAAAAADPNYSPSNLPNYYDVTTDATGSYKHEYTQSVIEASINVEF